MTTAIFVPVTAGLLALTYALFLTRKILFLPAGSDQMQQVAKAIEQGAKAYLKKQYTVISALAVVIALILWQFLGFNTSLGFLVGAFASGVSGFLGMLVAVKANVRTAQSAKSSLAKALNTAFSGGAITGFLVGGLALLSLSLTYQITKDMQALVGLGFGGSLISIFARLGGGIYTKAADVGADLVGKTEVGIPEDDPRNPAVIADNVGDNVGDDAGMAADLFETYVVSAIAAMLLGSLTPGIFQTSISLPLIIGAISIIASVFGCFFVRLDQSKRIMRALYKGLIATTILAAAGFFLLTQPILPSLTNTLPGQSLVSFAQFACLLTGLLVTILIVIITEYYTSKKFSPVKKIAQSATTGHGTNIITGLAISMQSTALPIVVISAGIFAAHYLAGLHGIALATMSMLSLTPIIIAIDAFGPVTDNAGGIAEMAKLESSARQNTDALDAVGNTTKAITKGYAISSAGLAALVLFSSFSSELAAKGLTLEFSLADPLVLIGLFLGAALPYLFSALAIEAVGKTAGAVVQEVRRQFKEIKGIMEGKAQPDYGRAVEIVTGAALQEMFAPALIPLLAPVLTAFILGPKALGGLLIGSIVAGLLTAISMTTGGAAWDNAKKYIEEGNYGGKGSLAHAASITGDTVGDPYKDTAGPAINPMIKIINLVALLIIPFLV